VEMRPPCELHGTPGYWDSYWFARAPDNRTGMTGPEQPSSADGFYANLLAVRRFWQKELGAESMMQLELPATASTNGTWLNMQARHSIVRAMIGRADTWHPRYGVTPGYGQTMQDGFQDTFTSTAAAALEWGAMPWARGLIDNQFSFYVRDDGMIYYRAEELPQTARMLTILALYYSYSGDSALLLKHFDRARAVAEWLLYRRSLSLEHSPDDPRYGIPPGDDEADNYHNVMFHNRPILHFYSSAAELYRACTELGRVWSTIGGSSGREDVSTHGRALLKEAPSIHRDLHASLNRTMTMSSQGDRCWMHRVEGPTVEGQMGDNRRTYSEMFYSAALTPQQVRDIFNVGVVPNCSERFLTLGSPSAGLSIFTHIPHGFPYGLLAADMIEPFLLHLYAVSAHSYTRGTWTTPESASIDRDTPTIAYASAGVNLVPLYLKWALVFEEPESRTLWVGKATPREWLAAGASPLSAADVPTRYGRVSFRLNAQLDLSQRYRVSANVTLPSTFSADGPSGGVLIRLRAPAPYAGRMIAVTVGGKAWDAFDAATETVHFAPETLTPAQLQTGLPAIVATFTTSGSNSEQFPLR